MNKRDLDRCLTDMQAGDNGAFARLYEATVRGLYAFLYAYYADRADTEDAVHCVYVKVKTNCLQYRPGTDARAWMLQIAKNHALNELSRRKRESPLEAAAQLRSYDRPLQGTAFDALNTLRDAERETVIIHVLWGYKHREIADMKKIPLGTVTARYKKAIAKMREYIEKEEGHA